MTVCLHSSFLRVSENCINCLIYISIRVHQLRGISGIIIRIEHHISQKRSRVRGLAVNQVTFHFLLTFLFPLQKIFDAEPRLTSTIHPARAVQRSRPASAAGTESLVRHLSEQRRVDRQLSVSMMNGKSLQGEGQISICTSGSKKQDRQEQQRSFCRGSAAG